MNRNSFSEAKRIQQIHENCQFCISFLNTSGVEVSPKGFFQIVHQYFTTKVEEKYPQRIEKLFKLSPEIQLD
jgi:hypothetical protein